MEQTYLKFYRSANEAQADVEFFEENINSSTEPEEIAIYQGLLA